MLEVPDIQCIRVMYQRGVPIRQIAREMHVSRKTVRKYTAEGFVVEPEPRQRAKKPRPAPQMDRWKPVLAQWVAKDEEERRKQRQTARRMYQRLVEEYGATVSEASVRRYVAHLKGGRAREAYVPLEFKPGSMTQVDFGHADVVLAGERRNLPFIAMRLMASTVSFVKMFSHAKLEAWMDGICSGLSFFGGVAEKAMFDNDSTLVKQVLAGGRRLQTPEFRALAAHYGFEAVFANPGRGNEKGSVEHLVRWAQQNAFSPVPEARSLGELNEQLARRSLKDAEQRKRDGWRISGKRNVGTWGPCPRVPLQPAAGASCAWTRPCWWATTRCATRCRRTTRRSRSCCGPSGTASRWPTANGRWRCMNVGRRARSPPCNWSTTCRSWHASHGRWPTRR